jgi:hypothetical protein
MSIALTKPERCTTALRMSTMPPLCNNDESTLSVYTNSWVIVQALTFPSLMCLCAHSNYEHLAGGFAISEIITSTLLNVFRCHS